ncbi:SMP-30/gluconolactonase/LRE family protein [Microbispora sp. KK1-11]|uniref:SMP-30/gluconolactonase/LRE family protein n=1 Tax=Microbispora sp. KK1-11 TaxID=2053005 RepID=UPI00115A02A6|nr:SMP-30/gluconolactonase/LRE family protein [Microbispora sp. KK1-11]TQS28461.1 SMP-30/gluconolactonase/LRE family protein [Microbispora sp. KK1-11]
MTTRQFTAAQASAEVYALGEGPVWDPGRQRLLWVDIDAGAVHEGRLDPATGAVAATTAHTFGGTVGGTAGGTVGGTVGAVAVSAGGELVVAEREVLTRVDTAGRRTELARVLPPGAPSRLNDGAVDPAGRFLIGSMALDDREGQEVLVRLDGTTCVRLDDDLTLSNGLAWSPAGDRMYSIDSTPHVVWERDYDPATGRTGPRRELFRLTGGMPDGMCADAEGNLWIAVFGGGRVECRDPGGRLLATVEVGAPNVTCPAFAGPDLDVLVITTSTEGVDLAEHPGSGHLFTARVGVRGLATPYWVPPRS